ncbi:bifunctional diguanylate cyclase/phosphodiesterase [Bacillus marasmi]|uniref:bifunctional diguanylate cyclase/phosphodiesterase n=1 Tax=Bacillus marasmi TaxID=1926279 RepID=UPI001FE32FC2|nr:EAL domain-containing protein [Bacillus marasmi]
MNRSNSLFYQLWKQHGIIIILSIVILFISIVFRQSLYGVFGEQNYLTIHLIMGIFIITFALSIAIQSWLVFPHSLSSYRLWIGALFLAVALLELVHTITYNGMPYFISESSPYKATWLFMATRLTEVIGLLTVIATHDKHVSAKLKYIAYCIATVYAFGWIAVVYSPTPLLPELVVEGIGTTALKNNLQYVGMIIEVLVILIVIKRFRTMEVFSAIIIVASVYLIISDYYFTSYKSVFDINNFIGHIFQIAGYYFLQRAVYHTAVEEPFLKQRNAEILLKQNEKFLKTITSNMGEGLVVLDVKGNVTLVNSEAIRLIQWSQQELLGENFHKLVHQRLAVDNYLFCTYPNKRRNQTVDIFQEQDDYFRRKDGTTFPASYVVTPYYENNRLSGVIIVFRDITRQKKDQEMIQYMAFYDELTKLPNLRYVKDKKLNDTLQLHNHQSAVIILDIDRFKKINEALGHAFGDTILKVTAERLQEQLYGKMLLVRLTGDEFAIILPNIQNEAEIEAVVDSIHQTFRKPLVVNHLLVNISISAGVAIYPQDGREIDELLKHANLALRDAQQQNAKIMLYQPTMAGKAYDYLLLENDLYYALANQELFLVYQPQVNIETGKISGVEALLRWNHPKHGLIPPNQFIPIAEDTGMIIPIGEWVLRTSCKQLKEWHKQGISDIVIAVNLSIRQFYQQNLVETVKDILIETELDPHFLELEITESMMMNREHAQNTIHSLKELGIQIAIDDFGTGYSSLSYLKHLPFDRLKIDQSFVRDLLNNEKDTTIVSTIISMAHHFNLNVIAEGVETLKQKDILFDQNCMFVQGYLFSPPIPPGDLNEKISEIEEKIRKNVDKAS